MILIALCILSCEEISEIETKHNEIRSTVSPKAASMLSLIYNFGLERTAQIWAEMCHLQPSKQSRRFRPGSFMVGENVFVSETDMTWSDVIDIWAQEKSVFTYGSGVLFQTTHSKCGRNSDDPKCGTTYNQTTCSSSFETMLHCPWLCNVCPYAGYNYSERSAPLPWERNRTECPSLTTSHTFGTSTQTTVTVHKGRNGSPCASSNQWIIMLIVFIHAKSSS